MQGLNIPITDHEIDCLFQGLDLRDTISDSTVNLSSNSPITVALLEWMIHVFNATMTEHTNDQKPTPPTTGDGQGKVDVQPTSTAGD